MTHRAALLEQLPPPAAGRGEAARLALSAADVAMALGVHQATFEANLASMLADGFPPARRIGRQRRWSRPAIEAWLAHRSLDTAPSETAKLLGRIDAL